VIPAMPLQRRQFLQRSFVFSAAAALGVDVCRTFASKPAAPPAAPEADAMFLAIGDFGSNNKEQRAVASAMRKHLEDVDRKPSGLLLVGDNFYGKMTGGVKSDRWRTGFEQMYDAATFPGPCYAVLGNHDYNDNKGGEQTQLAYAAATPGTRWTMPAKWYRVDYPKVNPVVTMLFLDSNVGSVAGIDKKTGLPKPSLNAKESAEQLKWFAEELAKPRAAFTLVIAHHPLFSNGNHGDSKSLISSWDGLLRKHKVPFYLCGHDHDMQHLEFEGHPTSFLLSGGGGARTRTLKNTVRGPFGQPIYGFTQFQFTAEQAIVQHVDANRKLLHRFTKTPAGQVAVG
jgi:tartrate-resistant acid phosphatase type 5